MKTGLGKLWKDKIILVVEDDEVSSEFLNEVLYPTGAQIHIVTDGREAVEFCRKHKTDIVLMDIRLPVMNGQDALFEIRKFDNNVIIIAQTAFAMSGDKEKYMNLGFDDYISKPTYPKDLIELLSKYI